MTEIKQIEALMVEEGEVLVMRIAENAFENAEALNEFTKALDATPLKGRYVIFSGKVEFSKVKL